MLVAHVYRYYKAIHVFINNSYPNTSVFMDLDINNLTVTLTAIYSKFSALLSALFREETMFNEGE